MKLKGERIAAMMTVNISKSSGPERAHGDSEPPSLDARSLKCFHYLRWRAAEGFKKLDRALPMDGLRILEFWIENFERTCESNAQAANDIW